MALKDFTLGKRNRIAVGGVTAVGLIIYGVSNLIAPAYRVDNTEGERLFEISTHGALGTGTGNAFGTIGQVLTSGGGSGKLMSWTTVPTIAGAGAGADADARYVNVAGDTMTGALAIKVTSGTSTGNTLVVDTNGLVYDATNKRVGIGTTSPLRKFQVEDTGNAFAAVYKNAATPSSFLLAAEGAQNRIYSWTTPTNSADKPLYITMGADDVFKFNTDFNITMPKDNQQLQMGAAGATDYYQMFDGTNTQFNSSGKFIFNGGNFGIGNTNPLYPLHVTGNIVSNTGGFYGRMGVSGVAFDLGSISNIQTRFVQNNTVRMTLDANGHVQIPFDSKKLLLGIGQDASIYYDGTNMVINPKEVGSGVLEVQGTMSGTSLQVTGTGATPLIYADSGNGNVGIGTTSPTTALEVVGTISGTTLNVSNDIRIDDTVMLGLPDQTDFLGTVFLGTGGSGASLANNIGNEGRYNTFIGMGTGNATDTGAYNTGVGYQALYSNTQGSYNTANGYLALRSNTTGSNNTANGYLALNSNTTGMDNTANGYQALRSNTTGSYNTANGYYSLYSNTTGRYNIANGYQALYSNTQGSYNIANGYLALYNNTTGGNNTANGYGSLYANITGDNNTADGFLALRSNTTGRENTANGYYSLRSNITGSYNTTLGANAGRYLSDGATDNETSDYSTYLGYNAKASVYNAQNEVVIGYNAVGAGDNSVVLGNDSITKTLLKGNVGIGTISPTTALEVIGTMSGKGLKINGDSDFTGDVVFSETGSGLPYAEIYLADGSTAQAIATGAGYTKLTGYATDGLSNNATSAVASDKITITVAGVYKVDASISASSGTANVTFRYAVFLNGVEQNAIHAYRKYAASGDNGANSMTGYIDVTTVPWDLDVRARHDNGGSINLTPTYMNLNVSMVGGT